MQTSTSTRRTPGRRAGRGILLTVLAALLMSLFVLFLEGGAPARAVVGGHEAHPGEYPYMAQLLDPHRGDTTYKQFFCGGTMIDGDSVLTAAHCFLGLSDQRVQSLSVRVGSTGLNDVPGQGVRRGVLRVWIHGKYNFTPNNQTDNQYDVAVITLRRPALNCNQSGCGKGTVNLANPSQDYLERPGTQATVVGWGSTEWGSKRPSYVLQQADSITVRSDQDGEAVWDQAFVPKSMIAAGSQWRGANFGDSGGPLLVRAGSPATGYVWVQIGIASFVDSDPIRRLTCDLTNWKKCYDVFTEVNNPSIDNFIKWASIR